MNKKLKWIIPTGLIAVFILVFLIYTGNYYHADATALAALESDDSVSVSPTDYGWFFDGPSEENVLAFYPGAKIEETAYAPLMHLLAEQGMDICLLKMPFRLAFFRIDKADQVLASYEYENKYVGGHSLGGAMAAVYVAKHEEQLSGLILLAAYPTKSLADLKLLISIYGSEDGILNMDKVREGHQYEPEGSVERVIEGGNHAQFGNYGAQKGDGNASVSWEEQQELTSGIILESIHRRER